MPVNLTLDDATSWSGGGWGVSIPLWGWGGGWGGLPFVSSVPATSTLPLVGVWVGWGGVNPFVSSSVPVNFTLPLVGGWGSPFGQLLDGPLDTTVPQVAGVSPLCGVLASSVDFAECP